ncbi:hypothetical protein GCM10027168_44190 [Streptomyces capparidis]
MSDESAATTAPVHVEYHMFYLTEPGTPMDWLPPAPNGLIGSRPGAAVIYCGAGSGLVTVHLHTRPTEPPAPSTDAWEEVLDHSINAPEGAMHVTCVMDNPPDLPSLTPFGPGTYRLRVHARSRDLAPDAVAFEPIEEFLLITWPETHLRPDRVHKQTDHYGAQRRRSEAAAPAPADPDRPAFRSEPRMLMRDEQASLPLLLPEDLENIRRHRQRRTGGPTGEEILRARARRRESQ